MSPPSDNPSVKPALPGGQAPKDRPFADANLLFGVLALQMDFITHDQLVAGMRAWVNEKQTPLAELLVKAGSLQADRRNLLEPLVAEHVRRHGGDPGKSLAALSTVDQLRGDLKQIPDGDVQQSLNLLRADKSPADPDATLSVGERSMVGARFRILRSHAEGGLGQVFVARDEELGREVALKEIKTGFADDPESRRRFVREAEITGGLEHPSIVPVYGLGQYADGRPFYAMRLIKGDSLKEAIAAFHATRGAGEPRRDDAQRNLELRRLLQQLIDVCEALEYAHSRGVLHRDLKPGNIMLGKFGETLVVDWGLARAGSSRDSSQTRPLDDEETLRPRYRDSAATQMGSAIGTPAYMPPEQALGRLDLLGPASDVYSLGATLYCLLTGKPPVEGADTADVLSRVVAGRITPPQEHDRTIPPGLAAICQRALAREPADRYPSARRLADDLEKWLADEAVAALPERTPARLARWLRRNRHWAQAGGAALLLVALITSGAYLYQRHTATENLRLANEKGRLAEEKGQLAERNGRLAEEMGRMAEEKGQLADEKGRLATDNGRLASQEQSARKDAEAKAASLRAALAQNYFTHGLGEYKAGRPESAVLDLQRAWAMTPADHALRPHFRMVLLDWAQRGAKSLSFPLRHEGRVTAVAFSPQGDRVLTGSADKTARLWDARTGEPLGDPMRHGGEVHAVAFSPQGDRVLTGSYDHFSQLWDAHSSVPLGEPMRHEDRVLAVAFSSKGDRVLTGSEDKSARLWDAHTGEPLGKPMQHEGRVHAVAFSPRGDRVLTGSQDNTARLWEARNGSPLGTPMRHYSEVGAVAFSPLGDQVLTGSQDNTARLWDASNGAPLGEPMRHEAGVVAVAFSPQGDRVLTGSKDNTARQWDARSGALLGAIMRHEGPVEVVAFSPQGDHVLTGSADKTARLWDAHSGAPLGEPMRHEQNVRAVAFNSGGDRVLTGSDDYTARLWDNHLGAPMAEPLLHESSITSVAFSPQGDRVLTGSYDNTARLWVARTGAPLGKPMRHEAGVVAVAFSPQGDRVLTGSYDTTARLWDAHTGAPLGEPMQHKKGVFAVAFSPLGGQVRAGSEDFTARLSATRRTSPLRGDMRNGGSVIANASNAQRDRVLTGSWDRTARLWDGHSGAPLGEPLQHEESVHAVAFSPQGDRVLTGSNDKTARFWDAHTGTPLGTPMPHEDGVMAVAFSPQGGRVLTVSYDNAARLWDARSGAHLGEPMRHEELILAVVFNSQGDRVLTGSQDNTARLWDAYSGAPLGEPMRHEGLVESVAFSPQGDRVLTGSSDKTARLWDASTGAPLGAPMQHEGPVKAVASSPQGDRVLTGSHDKSARIWDVAAPPLPERFTTYIELLTYHVVDLDGNATKLTLTQWQERWKALQLGDAAWLTKMLELSRTRIAAFHRNAWQISLARGDRFAARSHAKALQDADGLDARLKELLSITLKTDANSLLNGDFEAAGVSNSPPFWVRHVQRSDAGQVTIVEKEKDGSEHSLRLQSSSQPGDLMCVQAVNVTPYTDYKLTCRVKTLDVVGTENNGAFGAGLGLWRQSERSDSLMGTNDWTTVTLRFNSGNRTTVELGPRLGDAPRLASGTAWFDDIKLTKLPPK